MLSLSRGKYTIKEINNKRNIYSIYKTVNRVCFDFMLTCIGKLYWVLSYERIENSGSLNARSDDLRLAVK